MKKLLTLIAFTAMSIALSAQADTIYISEGQVVKYAAGAKIVTDKGTIKAEDLGGAIVSKTVVNNDTIKDADAGKVYVKTTGGSDTLPMGIITLANFTTEFFFNNASDGTLVITATLQNSFNGNLNAVIVIPAHTLGVAIKTDAGEFLIAPK